MPGKWVGHVRYSIHEAGVSFIRTGKPTYMRAVSELNESLKRDSRCGLEPHQSAQLARSCSSKPHLQIFQLDFSDGL